MQLYARAILPDARVPPSLLLDHDIGVYAARLANKARIYIVMFSWLVYVNPLVSQLV